MCRTCSILAAAQLSLKHPMLTMPVEIGTPNGVTLTKLQQLSPSNNLNSHSSSLLNNRSSNPFSNNVLNSRNNSLLPSRQLPLQTCLMTSLACQLNQRLIRAFQMADRQQQQAVDSNRIWAASNHSLDSLKRPT